MAWDSVSRLELGISPRRIVSKGLMLVATRIHAIVFRVVTFAAACFTLLVVVTDPLTPK